MPGRDLIERVRRALGDRYTVLTAVGRGGNASIFAAQDPSGAQVAIKVLHPELAVSVAADRFLREIRFASQLNHPHIARMMDSGEADYLLWYVMPYLPGETLRQTLRREARLPIPRAVAIAADVLDALAHAHAHGIAHRDIKPDNIVVAPAPQGAVLVDLGIARAIATSGDDRVTRSGFVVGTEEYMSPEQAQGAPDVDGRTDLYSLGVVLFECLAGRPPFSSPSAAAVLDMHQHHPPPDVHGLRREVPKELAAVVTRALAKSRTGPRAPFGIRLDPDVAIARRLGAGRLVMGQLWSFGDTLRLTAGLYDVARGGAPVRESTTRVAANGAIGAAFNALADSLLGADVGAARGAGAAQTRSLQALRAYALGERAIRDWDLGRAAREFRAAVAVDSGFARAYLELGQALLWAADSAADAGCDRAVIARRTGDLVGTLGGTDGALLLAQQAVFERRWPDACRQYREIVEADSTSFAGWYGLAECNAGDPIVVADPQDTARFAFRGSWHTAVVAYRRALLLAPSFNFIFGRRAAERLTPVLQAGIYWLRAGRRDGMTFYAFPKGEGDTLAFHPVPAAQADTLSAGTPTHVAAVGRNRATLIEVTAAWVGAVPGDARAHRALAYALEVNGNIAPAAEAPRSALTEIQAAQRLEPRPQDRVGDAVAAVRLLVKAGEFEEARRLGDSLLRAAPRGVAGPAGVAVLLGRPTLAARLVAPEDPETEYPASADNQSVTIPIAALRVGLELLAYASAGAPAESVAALEARVERSTAGRAAASRPAGRGGAPRLPRPGQFCA